MPAARRIIVLGSTGSIGTATLEVVRHLRAAGALLGARVAVYVPAAAVMVFPADV